MMVSKSEGLEKVALLESVLDRLVTALWKEFPEGLPQPYRDLVNEAEKVIETEKPLSGRKHDVQNPSQALAYITDCNLATACNMAMKKGRSKAEFERQKVIAQKAVDWMIAMGVDFSVTRAADVVRVGSVDAWAETFFPKK